MKRFFDLIFVCVMLISLKTQAQVQWASKLIDFSSEYKDDLIRSNSTRWSASQVLGYPNSIKYGSSQLAWTPQKQDGSKEFVTVGFTTPQMVQQVIVGENYNAGSICEIILYDDKGKKYTVYENERPSPIQKFEDVLTYFKIKPTYNVVKLKLVINTSAVFGRQEIDCIGISATTAPYKQNINVVKYSEAVGQPENLGPNVNSEFYDHLPLISPDGTQLYFTRKLTDENNSRYFNDDIFVAQILPSGKFSKAENIGPPLNTTDNNFACFISSDNNRLYVANKYIKNTYNYAGLSVSTKHKDGTWSKPKSLSIPNLYNKNEFAHYYMNLEENVALMSIQRDDTYGDLDIYFSKKYSDGTWTEPKNLGPVINTVGAEGSVFLAADGKTLYFSSTGHPGFGSYDMYMSKRLDDTWTNWSKPLNLGYKINSDEMDIYYTIPASGDYAYFSSGITQYGKNDLYRIKLPKEARPEFVDIKKFVASAPLKKDAPIASAVPVTSIPLPPTPQKVSTSPTSLPPTAAVVPAPPSTKTTVQNTSQTEELQKKLEELKKQQLQASTPVKSAVATPPAAPPTAIKREVVNNIQPFQTEEEKKPKPITTNTIVPVETPKPGPHVLTQQEIQAREQQKNNPTISPNTDNLNALSKRPMPTTPETPPITLQSQKVSNPNIVTNEVDPNTVIDANSSAQRNSTLKTANPQTDELQQKLEDLRRQQTVVMSKTSAPSAPYSSTPSSYQSTAEKYPNPQAVTPQSNAKTDDLQQKLDALKQQQQQVGQSNKIYANPYYTSKPYDPQPVKERQDDVASKEYDDYAKKIEDLKRQQKNTNVAVVSPSQITNPTPVPTSQAVSIATAPAVTTASVSISPNPIISKYEEKLKKLKEEMDAMKAAPTAVDTKLSAEPLVETITATAPAIVDTPLPPHINSPQVSTAVVVSDTISTSSAIPTLIPSSVPSAPDFYAEKYRLDSIQQAQKLAEQKMMATLDKMGNSKQSLEKDIADLQVQRQKFNTDKDKLLAQNTQLAGEKDRLEDEKKKMDDLLSQMQTERDKLAVEKKKMEDDKAKLDALKKQQEKEVLGLKRSIDSLSKVQQKAVNTISQNYDLFTVPLQVGAVAQVNNIYFVADAAFLQIPSYPELDKVVLFLARNKNLKVEVGGHTNGLCDDYFCQKLSTSRAKTCVDYLISKGIAANRLSYKGYGKTDLLKPNEPGNPLNQRVEIKIISVD